MLNNQYLMRTVSNILGHIFIRLVAKYDGTDFSVLLDGSDVGLASTSVDAFAVISSNELLLSFRSSETIPGITGTVRDSDIVKFTATQLGDTTSGSFELFFRGSDVGLSASVEDVDAVDVHSDGRLIFLEIRFLLRDGIMMQIIHRRPTAPPARR